MRSLSVARVAELLSQNEDNGSRAGVPNPGFDGVSSGSQGERQACREGLRLQEHRQSCCPGVDTQEHEVAWHRLRQPNALVPAGEITWIELENTFYHVGSGEAGGTLRTALNPSSIRYDSTDDAGPLDHLGNCLSHLATVVRFFLSSL